MSDLERFYAYRSNPDVARYQGWLPQSLEEAQNFIAAQQIGSLEPPGSWLQVAVALRSTNAIVGDIGLCLVSRDEVEIGFSLAPAAQGFGYAQEAVAAAAGHLHRGCGVRNLRAITDTRNEKSIALLQRLGFVLKRTSSEIFHGQWCEQLRFVLRLNGDEGR